MLRSLLTAMPDCDAKHRLSVIAYANLLLLAEVYRCVLQAW